MNYKKLKGEAKTNQKFSSDLTVRFNELTSSRSMGKTNFSHNSCEKSEFLRITNELSYKLKKIDNDMNQMKINLKAANLFLNNDEKINDLIVKIKEELSEVQSSLGALNKCEHDFCFNSQAESVSKNIIEILQVRALKSAENFQNILKLRADDIKNKEDKSNAYKAKMNNPSKLIVERLRNRPLFLDKDLESSNKENEKEKDPDENELKYKRESKKYDQFRSESIKNIERLLHEVGSTFQRFFINVLGLKKNGNRIGAMVKMQESLVDRIDKDVDHTVFNVNKGKENLMKHYEDIKSNKGTFIRVKYSQYFKTFEF